MELEGQAAIITGAGRGILLEPRVTTQIGSRTRSRINFAGRGVVILGERPAFAPAALEDTGERGFRPTAPAFCLEPDSPLERAGFEPSVPGESGFDFAREVRGRLFAGGRWIRTIGTA
jgi:hypothetical protein